jgi:hypothetical protein
MKHCFQSAFNADFLAGMLCGLTTKLYMLSSDFHPHSLDSDSSGVKPPKAFLPVSRMSVSVFSRQYHRA